MEPAAQYEINQNTYENILHGIKNGANDGLTAGVAFMALYGTQRYMNYALNAPLSAIGLETNLQILEDKTDFGGLTLLVLSSFTLLGAVFGGIKGSYDNRAANRF